MKRIDRPLWAVSTLLCATGGTWTPETSRTKGDIDYASVPYAAALLIRKMKHEVLGLFAFDFAEKKSHSLIGKEDEPRRTTFECSNSEPEELVTDVFDAGGRQLTHAATEVECGQREVSKRRRALGQQPAALVTIEEEEPWRVHD